MVGHVTEISDAEFNEKVLKATNLVVVDFWAPWCAPCKSIAPLLDELALELGAQAAFFKINVDENPKSPAQYSVRAIPNIVMFKGGSEVNRVVGAKLKDELLREIRKSL